MLFSARRMRADSSHAKEARSGRAGGGEAVEIGDRLLRFGALGVGLGALGEGGWDARIVRIAGDELAERADGSLVVARLGKAPAALIEQAGAVLLADRRGVDLAVNLGGGGGLLVGEEGLRLHHQGGVDARVLRPEFPIELEKRVHLVRHVAALDLEEAQQAVVGCLEGEVGLAV
jgi:hypothetical protein